MTTIKDIAQRAGVSYSTVSKALNNSPLVKKETKEKILTLAKELGYEPNYAAQQLVSKQSKVIGLIWPTLERMAPSILVTKINEEISKRGYSMILSINSIDSSLEVFKRSQVDGIILFDEESHKMIDPSPHSIPLVTYGVSTNKTIPVIDVNYQDAMFKAVSYLVTLGHTKISFIGDFSPIDDRQVEKYIGFEKAMEAFNLQTNSYNFINTAGLTWYDGYVATKRLLNTSYQPTAIIGASYDISAGIIRALRESNFIIPKDLSVIGYDNIPQMANLEIPLTSIGVPIEEIAKKIVQTLFELINSLDILTPNIILEPVLNERSSCAQVVSAYQDK